MDPQELQSTLLLGRVAEGLERNTAAIENLDKRIGELAEAGAKDRAAMDKRIVSLESERTRQRTALRVLKWVGGILAGVGGWHVKQHWP